MAVVADKYSNRPPENHQVVWFLGREQEGARDHLCFCQCLCEDRCLSWRMALLAAARQQEGVRDQQCCQWLCENRRLSRRMALVAVAQQQEGARGHQCFCENRRLSRRMVLVAAAR